MLANSNTEKMENTQETQVTQVTPIVENTQFVKYSQMTPEMVKREFYCDDMLGIEKKILSIGLDKLTNNEIKQIFPHIKFLLEKYNHHYHKAIIKGKEYESKERYTGGRRSLEWGIIIAGYYEDKMKVYDHLMKFVEEDKSEKVALILDFIYEFYTHEFNQFMTGYTVNLEQANYVCDRSKAHNKLFKDIKA